MIEIAELHAVVEQHPVAQPVEPVGQQDATLGARRHAVQFGGALHAVADAQVELIGVRGGQGMRLPGRHAPIVPQMHAHKGIRQESHVPR